MLLDVIYIVVFSMGGNITKYVWNKWILDSLMISSNLSFQGTEVSLKPLVCAALMEWCIPGYHKWTREYQEGFAGRKNK